MKSSRSLILFSVLFITAIMVAPPLQNYFVQRAQISALEGEVSQAQRDLEEAKAQLQRWQDPEYIKSQARDRLRFVMPGEKQYIVLGIMANENNVNLTAGEVARDFPIGIPWYSRLLSSITSVERSS
ncbi:MAG: septum formation initiator family protein [Actinobacteria bacterium]|nr:septum formation initiator family protein [Actinomycetota bacterium]MDA2984336.1 septum formation initiator family protein [Actinomycetota bacterium]